MTTVEIRNAVIEAEKVTKKRKMKCKGAKKGSKALEVSSEESESDLEEQIDPEVEILDMIEVVRR